MPGFYGLRTAIQTRNKHRRTGKLVSSILTVESGDSKGQQCTFVDTYVWPSNQVSGVGSRGRAWRSGTITVYRVNGESYEPQVDDKLTLPINGISTEVRINGATSRLNADESSAFAVYDLEVATT